MFDKYTDSARNIISLAQQEAERFKHDYIGTEHLLLGLVNGGCDVALSVLNDLGIDVEKVRREVERLVAPADKPCPSGSLPFTPQVKRVLELAFEEACALGHPYIGTEHILLGLLSEQDSVAARVLHNLDVKPEDVCDDVLGLLGVSAVDASDEEVGTARESKPAAKATKRKAHDLNTLLDIKIVRREVEKLHTPTAKPCPSGSLPFTPQAERVLELAIEEARALGHPSIGTEHILLGLLSEQDSLAAQVLVRVLRTGDAG